MPEAALRASWTQADLTVEGDIEVRDPENGDFLGTVARPALLDRMRPEVAEALERDIAEDRERNAPLPLVDPVTNEQHGFIERAVFPTNLPDDYPDPDATIALVEDVRLGDNIVIAQLNTNPYNLLVQGTQLFPEYQVVLTNTAFTDDTVTYRMYANVPRTTTDSAIWARWTSQTSTANTTTNLVINDQIWEQWLAIPTHVTGLTALDGTGFYRQPPTPEEIAARAARRVEDENRAVAERVRYAEMEIQRSDAAKKARELLIDVLDDEQSQELITHARFHVRSQKKRLYRVRNAWSHGVDLIEDGEVKGTYCIHPRETVPTEDNMLAAKLMLESNEDEFIRIANYSPARRLA